MEREKCEKVLSACDNLIQVKDQQILAQQFVMQRLAARSVGLKTDLDESDAKLGSWYRNPILMILLGGIVGGGSALLITRH